MTVATRSIAPTARDGGAVELGAYRLLERLGAGGMATVYRARRAKDPDAGDVALKRLHPHLVDDGTAIASFAKEVRIACLLDHPAIRRVFSLTRAPGELFMVMEYVDGWSLRAVLERTRAARCWLTTRSVIAVLHRLCGALHYAHELVDEHGAPARFVHRDISPSNLIVSTAGRLKLIDLGVARADVGELDTRSGHIKGKYGYMAPEVLDSEPFDRRADVYSIGVVAWELLTLAKLFPVRDPPVDVDRVRARPIDRPSARTPSCPRALDDVVLRALAADPAKRWQTCAAMAEALQRVADELGEAISDSAILEMTEVFAETTVNCAPPLPAYRPPRLARGTTAPPSMTAAPRSIFTLADRHRRCPGCWRTLALGAAIGALVTVIGATHLSDAASAGAPPLARGSEPGSRAVAAVDAGVPVPDAGGALAVSASEVTRLGGPWPRSRTASYPYRARLCIDAAGHVASAEVIDGPARLERRILRALRRWRYEPFTAGGAPRPVCFELASRVRKKPRPR